MAKSNNSYIINIHYPETDNDNYELRKRLGKAYFEFVKDYILKLNISDEEKIMLYKKTKEHLNKKYQK